MGATYNKNWRRGRRERGMSSPTPGRSCFFPSSERTEKFLPQYLFGVGLYVRRVLSRSSSLSVGPLPAQGAFTSPIYLTGKVLLSTQRHRLSCCRPWWTLPGLLSTRGRASRRRRLLRHQGLVGWCSSSVSRRQVTLPSSRGVARVVYNRAQQT